MCRDTGLPLTLSIRSRNDPFSFLNILKSLPLKTYHTVHWSYISSLVLCITKNSFCLYTLIFASLSQNSGPHFTNLLAAFDLIEHLLLLETLFLPWHSWYNTVLIFLLVLWNFVLCRLIFFLFCKYCEFRDTGLSLLLLSFCSLPWWSQDHVFNYCLYLNSS